MLGQTISDPEGVEGGGSISGLGLLPVDTVLAGTKRTHQFSGRFAGAEGVFSELTGKSVEGYEIHMGVTQSAPADDRSQSLCAFTSDNTGVCIGNVYGTYIHGIFDRGEIAETVVRTLAERKGIQFTGGDRRDHRDFKEKEFDRLADILRSHLDTDRIYEMLREAAI